MSQMSGPFALECLGAAYCVALAVNGNGVGPAPILVPTAGIPHSIVSNFPLRKVTLRFTVFPLRCCSWGTP